MANNGKIEPALRTHPHSLGRLSFMSPPHTPVPVHTVCLLDDDPSVVKATSRLLSSAGWNVESFTDPIKFLSHAQTCTPQVVVLDILMPIMDGLEVQKRLRNFSPSSRVIVVTSKDDPSVRAKAMAAGAAAFFVKPVGDHEFLAGIESAF